jgi:hypothetical protein
VNGARVLAIAGTTSSVVAMFGGALLTRSPLLASVLLSTAPAVMLLGNLLVIFGRRWLR